MAVGTMTMMIMMVALPMKKYWCLSAVLTQRAQVEVPQAPELGSEVPQEPFIKS